MLSWQADHNPTFNILSFKRLLNQTSGSNKEPINTQSSHRPFLCTTFNAAISFDTYLVECWIQSSNNNHNSLMVLQSFKAFWPCGSKMAQHPPGTNQNDPLVPVRGTHTRGPCVLRTSRSRGAIFFWLAPFTECFGGKYGVEKKSKHDLTMTFRISGT